MMSYDPKLMLAQARIADLEAELADLRASSVELQIEFDAYRQASVVWRVRCHCVFSSDPSTTPNCPDCDNGWQLAEGVERVEWCVTHESRFWGGGSHGSIARCEWTTVERPPFNCRFTDHFIIPVTEGDL